jgi:hypothetical protein
VTSYSEYVELDVDRDGVVRPKGYGQVVGYVDTRAQYNERNEGRSTAKAPWTATLQGVRVTDGESRADVVMFVTHCFVATRPTFEAPAATVRRIGGAS